MTAHSAGILLHRMTSSGLEVWLGHMGGPFWARRHAHSWSIPKGETGRGETDIAAARREFAEEIGSAAPELDYLELGTFRYSSGKTVTVFSGAAPDFDPVTVRSNTFSLEWPPHSGTVQTFPEFYEARWLLIPDARAALVAGQLPALDALLRHLGLAPDGGMPASVGSGPGI